jgi:tRNA threonylcarbamoyladenosine biosynthesis protein TsaE
VKTYTINKLEDLQHIAHEFLNDFGSFQTFTFYAEMGLGKTTFIKALCKELNVEDLVTSPTFAILNEYYTPDEKLICHYDFYRIEKPEEVLRIGFEEYLDVADKIFIEWPEIIETLLPDHYVKVSISSENEIRTICVETI